MREITFKEYQSKVYELYLEIDIFLKKINLNYWVHSGTLLGIIRDGGMIAWDDDIDLMCPYNEFVNNKEKFVSTNEYEVKIFDFSFKKDNFSDMKYIKFISNKKYLLSSENGKKVIARPFVDLFFAVSSISLKYEKDWKRYDIYNKIFWIWSDGFCRYRKKTNKKFVTFLINGITYPMKALPIKRFIYNKLQKPYLASELNCNDKTFRRADYWARRKTIWNLEEMKLIKFKDKEVLINSSPEKELLDSYGKSWNDKPKKMIPHIFDDKFIFDFSNKYIISLYEE